MTTRRTPLLFVALCLAPALLGLVVFRLYPIALAISDSLFNVVKGDTIFVGLSNYLALFADSAFWKSLQVTLWFNLLMNPIQIALALGLALLYVQKFRGITLYRILFLIPIGVSLPTAVLIWRIMLTPDGLVNGLLNVGGLPAQPWLTSEGLALYSIIAIATWKGISYWMIFIVGGLQNISDQLIVDNNRGSHTFSDARHPNYLSAAGFVLIRCGTSLLFSLHAYSSNSGRPGTSFRAVKGRSKFQGLVYISGSMMS